MFVAARKLCPVLGSTSESDNSSKVSGTNGSHCASDNFSGDHSKEETDRKSIYVGNVNFGATEAELAHLFQNFGLIKRVTIIRDKHSGHSKGFAFIEFAVPDSVDGAITLNQYWFKGRQIQVSPKRTIKPVQGRGADAEKRKVCANQGVKSLALSDSQAIKEIVENKNGERDMGEEDKTPKSASEVIKEFEKKTKEEKELRKKEKNRMYNTETSIFKGDPFHIKYIIQFLEYELKRIEKINDITVSIKNHKITLCGPTERRDRAEQQLQELHNKVMSDRHNIEMAYHMHLLQSKPQILEEVGKTCEALIIPGTEKYIRGKGGEDLSPSQAVEEYREYSHGRRPNLLNQGVRHSSYDSQKLRKDHVMIGDCKFHVIKGLLQKSKHQAIVNSTGQDVNLQFTRLGQALSQDAGTELQNECNTLAPLLEGDVKVSKAYRLDCKRILHCRLIGNYIGEQTQKNLTKLIIKCLGIVDSKLNYQSVAFPALGTGNLKYPAKEVAKSFVDGLKSYKSEFPIKHLREVQVVIHPDDKDVYEAFLDTIQASAGENQDLTLTLQNADRPSNHITRKEQSKSLYEDSDAPYVIICGMKMGDIQLTIKKLTGRLQKETPFFQLELSEKNKRILANLCTEQVDYMRGEAKRMGVLLDLDTRCMIIRISGHKTAIDGYKHFIEAEFLKIEKGNNEQKLKEFHLSNITWIFHKEMKEEWNDFDWEDSYHLESTYKQNPNAEFTFGSRVFKESLKIDLHKKSFKFHGDRYIIRRIDKKLNFPIHWDESAGALAEVTLNVKTAEYQAIEANFMKTIQNPSAYVLEIKRVQHLAAYKQYMVQRTAVANKLGKPEDQVERVPLWHGSPEDTVHKIAKTCFDRSYAGMSNAKAYGAGSYFARDANYSARDIYSTPNMSSEKFMIQARVIVGEYTLGKSDMLVSPRKSDGTPFDSLVDNVKDPAIFVVFHDAAAYPEYIIKFRI